MTGTREDRPAAGRPTGPGRYVFWVMLALMLIGSIALAVAVFAV